MRIKLAFAIIALLTTTSIFVTGMGQPQEQVVRKAKTMIKIAEDIIAYIEELSIKARVNVSAKLQELKIKLKAIKALLAKGEYNEIIKTCRSIIKSAGLLQTEIITNTKSDFKEKFKEMLQKEEVTAEKEAYKNFLKVVEKAVEKSNATHLMSLVEKAKGMIEKGSPEAKQRVVEILDELRSEARGRIEEKVECMTEEILESYEEELIIGMWKGKNNTKQKLRMAIERLKEMIKKLKDLLAHLGEVNASKKAIEALEKVIERLSEVMGRLRLIHETMGKGIFDVHEMLDKIKDAFKEFQKERRSKQGGNKHKEHGHYLPIEIKEIEYPTKIPINGNITITLVLKNNLNKSVNVNVVIVDEEGNVLVNQSKVITAYAEGEFELNLTLSLTKSVCKLKLIVKYDDETIERSLKVTVMRSSRSV